MLLGLSPMLFGGLQNYVNGFHHLSKVFIMSKLKWMCNNTCESRRHYLKCHKIYILNQHTNLSFIFEWQRQFQIVSHKNYNLIASEGFVIFLTSKSITCFIDGLILIMKSQSIAFLLNGSEHIYWILDFEGEVHSIWDL